MTGWDGELASLERACRASLIALRRAHAELADTPDAAMAGPIVRRIAAESELLSTGLSRLSARLRAARTAPAFAAPTEAPAVVDIVATAEALAQMRAVAEGAATICEGCGGIKE